MLKFTKKGVIIISSLLMITGIALFYNTSYGAGEGVKIELTTLQAHHIPRLHSLYFSQDGSVGFETHENKLMTTNGIVVGNTGSRSKSTAASIGGGRTNSIDNNSNYAGVAGGLNNNISAGENSIIGGGRDNNINGKNAIIVGGAGNSSLEAGSVMGGSGNNAESGGVVLGGQGNTAKENGLALGSGAESQGKSFSWNAIAPYNTALVNANNGILIGTTQTRTGVNLVVNGAIKIGGTNSQTGVAGEIKVVNGCFYAYDGHSWHVINRNTTGNCNGFGVPKSCKFGNIELQDGDQVIAYKTTLAQTCDSKLVTCVDGVLLDDAGSSNYKEAFCFTKENTGEPQPDGVKCPAKGVCQETSVGGTCISYSTGISTNCDGAKITSKCLSNGKWDKDPGNYNSCEPVSCPAKGACQKTPAGQVCITYSANVSNNCDGVKVISTCKSDGNWDNEPKAYTGCDSCAEGEHMQIVVDPITNATTVVCVTNKCKGSLPDHASENNPNATPSDPQASYPSSPSDSTEACEWSCDDGYDWVKNPCKSYPFEGYECKKADHYERRFYQFAHEGEEAYRITQFTSPVISSTSEQSNGCLGTQTTPPKGTMRTKVYAAYLDLYSGVHHNDSKETTYRGECVNRNLEEVNMSTINAIKNKYSYSVHNDGNYGVYVTMNTSQFENGFYGVKRAPTKNATTRYYTNAFAKEAVEVNFGSDTIPTEWLEAEDYKDKNENERPRIALGVTYFRVGVDYSCTYNQNNPTHNRKRHADLKSYNYYNQQDAKAVPTPIYNFNECSSDICTAGTYRPTGSSNCISCPEGKWSTAGASQCNDCNDIENKFSRTSHGTTPDTCEFTCKGGYKYNGANKTCDPCGTGTYTTDGNTSTTCLACTNGPENSYYTSSGTNNNCDWECNSPYTKSDEQCIMNGASCGNANGKTFNSKPTSELCGTGTNSEVTIDKTCGGNKFSRTCDYNGTTASCNATLVCNQGYTPVNGVCQKKKLFIKEINSNSISWLNNNFKGDIFYKGNSSNPPTVNLTTPTITAGGLVTVPLTTMNIQGANIKVPGNSVNILTSAIPSGCSFNNCNTTSDTFKNCTAASITSCSSSQLRNLKDWKGKKLIINGNADLYSIEYNSQLESLVIIGAMTNIEKAIQNFPGKYLVINTTSINDLYSLSYSTLNNYPNLTNLDTLVINGPTTNIEKAIQNFPGKYLVINTTKDNDLYSLSYSTLNNYPNLTNLDTLVINGPTTNIEKAIQNFPGKYFVINTTKSNDLYSLSYTSLNNYPNLTNLNTLVINGPTTNVDKAVQKFPGCSLIVNGTTNYSSYLSNSTLMNGPWNTLSINSSPTISTPTPDPEPEPEPTETKTLYLKDVSKNSSVAKTYLKNFKGNIYYKEDNTTLQITRNEADGTIYNSECTFNTCNIPSSTTCTNAEIKGCNGNSSWTYNIKNNNNLKVIRVDSISSTAATHLSAWKGTDLYIGSSIDSITANYLSKWGGESLTISGSIDSTTASHLKSRGGESLKISGTIDSTAASHLSSRGGSALEIGGSINSTTAAHLSSRGGSALEIGGSIDSTAAAHLSNWKGKQLKIGGPIDSTAAAHLSTWKGTNLDIGGSIDSTAAAHLSNW